MQNKINKNKTWVAELSTEILIVEISLSTKSGFLQRKLDPDTSKSFIGLLIQQKLVDVIYKTVKRIVHINILDATDINLEKRVPFGKLTLKESVILKKL